MPPGEENSRGASTGPAPTFFGILSVVALVPMLLEFGGPNLSPGALLAVRLLTLGFASAFVVEFLIALARARDRREFLQTNIVDLLVTVALLLVLLLVALHPFGVLRPSGLPGYVRPAQAFLVLNLILKLLRLFKVAARRRFHYARAFGLSFLAIILAGVLLLWLLPGSRAPGKDLSLVDAIFTSTSATCVTGLVVVDTGTHYSEFGQTIILALFQIGGLGLMTFAAFFAIALGKGMGIGDREVMRGVLNLRVAGTIVRVIVGILLITLFVEGVSAAILYGRWHGDLSPHRRLFHSVFHSVSAFCNAGFCLNADSLERYAGDPVVNATIMLEIVIGGLGFGVLLNLMGLRILGARLFARLGLIDREDPDHPGRSRLTVQTKVVLLGTAVLILAGAGLVYAFEADNPATLGGRSGGEKIQAALFQSITARTAGFNTVRIGKLEDSSKFVLAVLMMIGASPGSTGGGVKTVTAVILLLSVISLYRNRSRVEVFRRTIPQEVVNRAIVIVVSGIAVVTAATLVLVCAEGGKFSFLSVLFEVVSAFGTVGLSTGITPGLCATSKLALCVVMLVGRIGPLSLVIALSQARRPREYEYPEEHLMIG